MGYPKVTRGPFLRALRFGIATSDRVNVSAGLNDQHTFTHAALVFPTAFTSGRNISFKGDGSGQKSIRIADTSGNLEFLAEHVTTDIDVITTTPPLALNRWTWVFATADDSTKIGRIYSAPANGGYIVEAAGSPSTGSGAARSDAGGPHTIANEGTTTAFEGSIAFFGQWSRVLTRDEMVNVTKGYPPLNGAGLLMNLGERGVGRKVLNYAPPPASGILLGTIVGAIAKGHELGIPFRPMMRRPVVKAPAGAAAVTYPQLERMQGGSLRGMNLGRIGA